MANVAACSRAEAEAGLNDENPEVLSADTKELASVSDHRPKICQVHAKLVEVVYEIADEAH